jgi:hypothetical protein
MPVEGSNKFCLLFVQCRFNNLYTNGSSSYSNNVYFFNAAVLLKTEVYIKAGIRPTWDNSKGKYCLMYLLITIQEKKIIVTTGWGACVEHHQYLFRNPWINQPVSQFNKELLKYTEV